MIDTDKYEGHQPANLWGREIVAKEKRKIFLNTAWLSSIGNDVYSNEKDRLLMADAPLLLAEVERLSAEVRMLRGMVCLLEDSRITNMSILDRPELFADVAEVFRQRKEDTHGHLPNFGEEE